MSFSFTSISPASLSSWLHDNTLIVDIRPHAAYSNARIPAAVPLSVPSTLLKRPRYSLQQLADMLPSASARKRFLTWKSVSRILVYDADASIIPESSNIFGLLRKFHNDGTKAELAWLKGGFQAVWRDHRSLVDTQPPPVDPEAEDDEDGPAKNSNVLRTNHLPTAAFSLSSTTAALPLSLSHPSFPSLSEVNTQHAFNPFFDTIRQNVELSHGITEVIPLRLPRRVRRRINDLPFSWLQQIARRAAPALRPTNRATDSSSSEEEEETAVDIASVDEGSAELAQQFFDVELAEQKRLMAVMDHHSKESGSVVTDGANVAHPILFPFSITAGVEKGAKNRYRHIWPFEHARVRLHHAGKQDDDYVNASYVQPIGTKKRYIATQGPLPATFVDFWTLCWEQNVHVIVMLTREIEGSMVKCGTYWAESSYGPLRLKLISSTGPPESMEPHPSVGFFGNITVGANGLPLYPPTAGPRQRERPRTIIKRVFELSHTDYPSAGARKVVHLQYLDWSDMNVPDESRGVLSLIKEVNQAVEEISPPAGHVDRNSVGLAEHAVEGPSPILLHCSAGVGRTGGFIAVDAALDAIKQEMQAAKHEEKLDETPMEIDVSMADASISGPSMKTPMPDDNENLSSTRRWAESVRDETQAVRTRSSPFPFFTSSPMAAPSPSHSTLTSANGAAPAQSGFLSSEDSHFRFAPSSSDGFDFSSHASGSSSFAKHRYGQSGSSFGTSVSSRRSSPGDVSRQAQPQKRLGDVVVSGERIRTFSEPAPTPAGLGENATMTSVSLDSGTAAASHGAFNGSSWLGEGLGPIANTSSPLRFETLNSGKDGLFGPPLSRAGSTDVQAQSDRTGSPPLSVTSVGAGRSTSSRATTSPNTTPGTNTTPTTACSSSPLRRTSPGDGKMAFPLSLPLFGQTLPSVELNRTRGESLPSQISKTLSAPRSTSSSVEYKEPRALHVNTTPKELRTLQKPILEMVQDMREQRMSLCQSLRQYVFVHAVVVEGALELVDEEREREMKANREMTGQANWDVWRATTGGAPKIPSSKGVSFSGSSRANGVVGMSPGKRGASPTELLKEGTKGQVLLSKRPSVKRKQPSGEIDDMAERGRGRGRGRLRDGPLDGKDKTSEEQQKKPFQTQSQNQRYRWSRSVSGSPADLSNPSFFPLVLPPLPQTPHSLLSTPSPAAGDVAQT